jgi:hypothetical protein
VQNQNLTGDILKYTTQSQMCPTFLLRNPLKPLHFQLRLLQKQPNILSLSLIMMDTAEEVSVCIWGTQAFAPSTFLSNQCETNDHMELAYNWRYSHDQYL